MEVLAANIPISGDINCVNCTYEWSIIDGPEGITPYHVLSDPLAQYPIITGSRNLLATSLNYLVTITTPEGCTYNRSIAIIRQDHFEPIYSEDDLTTCTFRPVFKYILPDLPISALQRISARLVVKANYGQSPASTPIQFLPSEIVSLSSVTEIIGGKVCVTVRTDDLLLWGYDHSFRLDLVLDGRSVFSTFGNCAIANVMLRAADSPFFGPITVGVPNAFSPESPHPTNQRLQPQLSPNVYGASMSVFGRWGSFITTSEVYSVNNEPLSPQDLQSISSDGTSNGQRMNPGLFVYIVDYTNCSVAKSNCGVFDETPDIAFSYKEQALLPINAITSWNSISAALGTHNDFEECPQYLRKWINQSFCIPQECNDFQSSVHVGEIYLIR